MHKKLFLSVLIALFASTRILAQEPTYFVTVHGVKQGQFKGESTAKNHVGQIPAIGFDYSLTSPRDPSTGQASGRRKYTPITIIKEWGASSPQFFLSLITNETLTKVVFDFVQTLRSGAEAVFFRITLTNASVSSIHQFAEKGTAPNGLLDDAQPVYQLNNTALHGLEAISFTFEKIEIEDVQSKTTAEDDWQVGAN